MPFVNSEITWHGYYRRNIAVASALFAVTLPYIFMTNVTATRWQIVIQAVIFWLCAPACVATIHCLLRQRLMKCTRFELSADILLDFFGLTIAALFMVPVFHALTGAPYRVALSPHLVIALLPVFVGYALLDVHRSWRSQLELSLRLEIANAESAWQALSAQVKPHFLFNSLNTLEHLIGTDPKRAIGCLQHLASLYRDILESSRQIKISLDAEMNTVDHYLHVQQLRLGNRLKTQVDVSESLKRALVPANMLLNCVENSIKHGIEPSIARGAIDIRAIRRDDRLILRMSNPAVAAQMPNVVSPGFGQTFITEQLRLIYGSNATFSLENIGDEMVTEINLPWEEST